MPDRDSDEENITPESSVADSSPTDPNRTGSSLSDSYPTEKLKRHMLLRYDRPKHIIRDSVPGTMNKDGCYTYLHMHSSGHADLVEDFCQDKLPADEVYVPPHMQPINPEDEDDVVPDQHAAFGIQKATQKSKEPAWKDLGLGDLMYKGPGDGSGSKTRSKRRPNAGHGLPR